MDVHGDPKLAPEVSMNGRRLLFWYLVCASLVSCGGDDKEEKPAAECWRSEMPVPAGLRSTSHQPGVPSPDPVIDMVWNDVDGVEYYMYGFSRDEPAPPPREAFDLPSGVTQVSSPSLEAGKWYFVFIPVNRDIAIRNVQVSCGPYIIGPAAGSK